jgi:hypothetical protein
LLHHVLPTVMFCLTSGQKAMELTDHELTPLKQWAKINLSSFKLFTSGILS